MCQIVKQFKDKAKTKNQSPDDNEVRNFALICLLELIFLSQHMIVTPEALALNLGLKTVHAAILEAKVMSLNKFFSLSFLVEIPIHLLFCRPAST